MDRRLLFSRLSLASVFASYFVAFFLLPSELLNRELLLAFGLPPFVGPFFVSIVSLYSGTRLSTGVLVEMTPAVAAAILLLWTSQSSEGIAGDGPIWLIFLLVMALGLVVSGIGSAIGAAVRTVAS